MTKKDLTKEIINLVKTNNVFMERVSNILEEMNDQNKLHTRAIDINTEATREMTKSFNRVWKVFYLIIGVLVVLALAEKVKGLDYILKFF